MHTAASVLWLRSDLHAKAYGRFERQAEVINDRIKSQLKLPFLVLQGASGIYAASYSVEQSEFRACLESSQVALAQPDPSGRNASAAGRADATFPGGASF